LIAWCKSLLFRLWPFSAYRRTGDERDDLDPEIREVFFAELDDVTEALNRAFAIWRADLTDQAAMKSLRRGFHTLKGSALIIGATALGEFCGRLEQLTIRMNDQKVTITPEVIKTIEQAIALLPAFAKATQSGRPPPPPARVIGNKAQRLLA
jgi:chemosensory pili system protein ChpA (sensor histidine kinase/response regulator)